MKIREGSSLIIFCFIALSWLATIANQDAKDEAKDEAKLTAEVVVVTK